MDSTTGLRGVRGALEHTHTDCVTVLEPGGNTFLAELPGGCTEIRVASSAPEAAPRHRADCATWRTIRPPRCSVAAIGSRSDE